MRGRSDKTGSSYGLVFGIQGDYEWFYSFEAGNTDYQEFILFRYDPNGWSEIAPVTYTPAILPGAETNHLKASRNGDSITLEVNGTVLGTWYDSSITGFSFSGVTVSTYNDRENSEARFDNFKVSGLGSEFYLFRQRIWHAKPINTCSTGCPTGREFGDSFLLLRKGKEVMTCLPKNGDQPSIFVSGTHWREKEH